METKKTKNKANFLLDDMSIFPRLTIADCSGYALFKIACDLEAVGNKDFPALTTLYCKAFKAGCIEAGINLLRLFFITKICLDMEDVSPFEDENMFTELFEHILDELEKRNHPAYEYYKVLSRIYRVNIGNGRGDEKTVVEGVALMQDLAKDGNIYAREWRDAIISMAEDQL